MNWRQISPNSGRRNGSPPERFRFSIEPQGARKREELFRTQIIAAVEIAPIEAVFALLVANGVDEQN